MDEYFCDARVGVLNRVLNRVGDAVALANGKLRIDTNVEIHEIFKTHFANEALVETSDAFNRRRDGAHLLR